ncbi:amidase family protein [Nitrobacter sp.]|uniref:amidase family protein n=1 Tax=Nitrobacter sp. TaxID=29420 RepID=UPI0029CABF8E|nr:amidase family protein [Nitrobacter sp.]
MDALMVDASTQLELLSSKQISASELLKLTIDRVQSLNPHLNAVVAQNIEPALRKAEEIDSRRTRGERLGLLAGLPMTIKDTFDVDGLPASAGMEELLHRTARDAVVVACVKQQDAVVFGKTNTPVKAGDWQTYNELYGTTNNPWDQERTSGGSSGGSAVAVATGMASLEVGADIAGSLRIPASFCGVFAHKPTFGVVSQRGLVPPPESIVDLDLAVVGPITRSARDLSLLFSVISQIPKKEGAEVQLRNLRVALWHEESLFALDPQVNSHIVMLGKKLSDLGAIVEEIRSPVDCRQLMSAYATLLLSITYADMPPIQRAAYEMLRGPAKLACRLGAKPISWAQGVLGATARHREWLEAHTTRMQMGQQVQSLFGKYDVVLAPISAVQAFVHDHRPILTRKLKCSDGRSISYLELMNWVALPTVLGLPATAIPLGLTQAGLPVGAQIIGPSGSDFLTLAVAKAIEQEIGGFSPPPIATIS